MARSPITQLIELFHGLTPDQQALFLDQVDPQPDEVEKPAKRTRKPAIARKGGCAACDYFKSAPIHHDPNLAGYHVYQLAKSKRASGMAAAINKSLEGQRAASGPNCTICGNEEGYQDHSQPSPHYHAFAAPKTAQSAAGD
jgi:hypothetical protein